MIKNIICSFLLISLYLSACRKVIEVDQPVDSITTEGAFSNDVTSTAAVIGIYSKLTNSQGSLEFGSGSMTLCTGLSADEFSVIGLPNPDDPLSQLYTNELSPLNSHLSNIWKPAYFAIYQANSSLEGLENSKQVSAAVKNILIGECKFIRAFCLFYLTNLFGDIPLPLTSDWSKTYLVKNSSSNEIYRQIIDDLKSAQGLLPEDYSISKNERIRANKYAATALLSRVYLYQKDWQNAEDQASIVINKTNTYKLVSDLNSVFLKNSIESILQLQPNADVYPSCVIEQSLISSYLFYLTDNTLNAFDNSDERKTAWVNIDSLSFPGITFSYPYKYKISVGTPGDPVVEYYTVLRLAEQYLIRAEARAWLNKIEEAKNDLNAIRERANLLPTTATTQELLLQAIEHERQVELFAEWGHRWFDLIRTDKAKNILPITKGISWMTRNQLYPIPQSEILNNPNLTQNPDY